MVQLTTPLHLVEVSSKLRSQSVLLLWFEENTGPGNAFHAEILGAMKAIEIAHQYQWKNLWLESDSSLVVNAFKNSSLVPRKLRNRWTNCLNITKSMNFLVTRVYREGNSCVDALANVGLYVNHLTIWLEAPLCVRSFYVQNRLGRPCFRFVNI